MKPRLKLMVAVVLLSVAGISRASGTRHVWGTALLGEVTAEARSATLSLIPEPLDAQGGMIPTVVMYYALRPGERISLKLGEYSVTQIPSRWVSIETGYRPSRDSTSILSNISYGVAPALPDRPSVHVAGYGWYRGYYLARIEITPYVRGLSGSGVAFTTSLSLNLSFSLNPTIRPATPTPKRDPEFDRLLRNMIVNYDEAQPYRVAVSDTTGSWFNTTSLYLKLGFGTDGVYRLTASQLDSLLPGIASADPRTIQLFGDGKEVPIYVAGEYDGRLDDTDYVEFPGLRNYTGTHRIITTGTQEYNDYLNKYTDTTIVWLTYGVMTGERMNSNPPATVPADTLKVYSAFSHMETNQYLQYAGDIINQQDYRWTSADMWIWSFLGPNAGTGASFAASNIAANGDSAYLYAKFASWGSSGTAFPQHDIALRLNNGGDIDSALLGRYQQTVLRGRVSASSLVTGTNTVRIYSKPVAANSANLIIFDWFEAEYPRLLKAVNDSLLFDFRRLPERKYRIVQLTGLTTTAVALYRVLPSPEKISNVTFSGTSPAITATFADTVGPTERYILAGPAKRRFPTVFAVKRFAGLRNNAQQADYIIISHEKFLPEAEQYRQYIASSRGFSTRLVDVQDIFDEFGFGYPTAESLRDFLLTSQSWPGPLPSYLFLIGDASYDYKFYYKNYAAIDYVPSIGQPVSDEALVTWDSVGTFPQMYVGRLPVNNEGEVTQYLNAVKSYGTEPNSDWNKRYILFSGGDPTAPGQISALKAVNDSIIQSLIQVAPVGGMATHFYKTTNPPSDIGPYTPQQFNDVVGQGSLITAYIGHSGTETWDNGIGDASQLRNDRGRYSLISDFGCSTGKFAEPQVKAFSELFIIGNDASAIGYIGNSALGFESIARTLPLDFYGKILRDSVVAVGKAHLLGKLSLIERSGFGQVNQIMLFSNTLIGDPALTLDLPLKPNLTISASGITPVSAVITDEQDSAAIRIVITNFGSVTSDSVDFLVRHGFGSASPTTRTIRRPMPLLCDTLLISIPVRGMSGSHTVSVQIDPNSVIDELNEADNIASRAITVASTELKIVQPLPSSVAGVNSIVLLNPTVTIDSLRQVAMQIDTSSAFTSNTVLLPMGPVSTSYSLAGLAPQRRYWWRAKVQGGSGDWIGGSFIFGSGAGSLFAQTDSIGWSDDALSNVTLSPTGGVSLSHTPLHFHVISAGWFDGDFGSVEVNGANALTNTYARGHNLVVFDPKTYEIQQRRSYDTYDPATGASKVTALTSFLLDSIPAGDLLVSVIIDEGTNHMTAACRAAYKTIGSSLIDSLKNFNDSWAIIGKKGAAPGTAFEGYRKNGTGRVTLDTTFVRDEVLGTVSTPIVGPSAGWSVLTFDRTTPFGSSTAISVIGVRLGGAVDTLMDSDTSGTVDLRSLSARSYPYVKLSLTLHANGAAQSPVVHSWSLAYTPESELVTTPALIRLSADSVHEGEGLDVNSVVVNAGAAVADTIHATLLSDERGSFSTLQNFAIPALGSGDSTVLHYRYNSLGRRGTHNFRFVVNPDSAATELFYSNNSAEVRYTVVADTIPPVQPNLFITSAGIFPESASLTDETDSAAVSIIVQNSGSVTNDSVNVSVQQTYQENTIRTWLLRAPMPTLSETLTVWPRIKQMPGEHRMSAVIDPTNLLVESSKSDNSASRSFQVSSTEFVVVQPAPMSVAYISRFILLNPTSLGPGTHNILLDLDTLATFVAPLHFVAPTGLFSTSFDVGSLRRSTRYNWRAKVEGGSSWSSGTFFLGDSSASAVGQRDSAAWAAGTMTHTGFVAASGVRVVDTPEAVEAISAGYLDGNLGVVAVRGSNVVPPNSDSSHVLVQLDSLFNVVSAKRFFVSASPSESDSLAAFIARVPTNAVVVAVVIGEGSNNLSAGARSAYQSLGSRFAAQIGWRDSWALIGRKGAPVGSVPETFRRSTTGEAIADTVFFKPEKSGTILTPQFGPLAHWKTLTIDRTIPAGASATVTVLGVTTAGRADTIISHSAATSIDLQTLPASTYPNGRLFFTLAGQSSAGSPTIKEWILASQTPPELAIGPSTVTVEKTSLEEGESCSLSMTVLNVSGAEADSVRLTISADDAGVPRILAGSIVPVIGPYDSVTLRTTYDSRNRRGSHSFIFRVDPDHQSPEIDRTNDDYSVSYSVAADTVRPSVEITFDGEHVLDGDYVSRQPLIVVRMFDNNSSPITPADTSLIYLNLNTQRVFYGGSDSALFAPSIGPVRAEVRWMPHLEEGENRIEYFAQDISGNSSDTSIIYVNVASALALRDIYNIPNPFSRSTQFTFILTGVTVPDELKIRIFTVAGRAIEELVLRPPQLRIGFNKVFWDGRDKDGDEIGNGVYLYRIIASGAAGTVGGTQKLVKMR